MNPPFHLVQTTTTTQTFFTPSFALSLSPNLPPCSPVFIPHPVFVPERGEKDRIRQEVEERIVLEEKRLEEEERRRKLEIIRREENAQRLVQEEERRRQEVEYWRQQVQEEEERRRQEEELRLRLREEKEQEERKIKEEEERSRREQEAREEVLVPAASSREARIAVGNLLESDDLEGRKESVELPPRVRMECFRFLLFQKSASHTSANVTHQVFATVNRVKGFVSRTSK